MNNKKLFILIGVFLALFWLWPNLVHEPLHLLALKVQGSTGYINWSWNYPATPSTTRTEPVTGLAGGLLFLLLPSIINLLLVAAAFITRRKATILTHVVLPTYLVADVFINVSRRAHNTSDFYFLTAFNPLIGNAISGAILLLGFVSIYATILAMTQSKQNKQLLKGVES